MQAAFPASPGRPLRHRRERRRHLPLQGRPGASHRRGGLWPPPKTAVPEKRADEQCSSARSFPAEGKGFAPPGSPHAKAMPKRGDSVNSQRVTNSPKLLPEKGRCRRAGTSRRPYGKDGAAFLCRKGLAKSRAILPNLFSVWIRAAGEDDRGAKLVL